MKHFPTAGQQHTDMINSNKVKIYRSVLQIAV